MHFELLWRLAEGGDDQPAEASGIELKHALAELGVSELPGGHYTYEDAAVSRILLECPGLLQT